MRAVWTLLGVIHCDLFWGIQRTSDQMYAEACKFLSYSLVTPCSCMLILRQHISCRHNPTAPLRPLHHAFFGVYLCDSLQLMVHMHARMHTHTRTKYIHTYLQMYEMESGERTMSFLPLYTHPLCTDPHPRSWFTIYLSSSIPAFFFHFIVRGWMMLYTVVLVQAAHRRIEINRWLTTSLLFNLVDSIFVMCSS